MTTLQLAKDAVRAMDEELKLRLDGYRKMSIYVAAINNAADACIAHVRSLPEPGELPEVVKDAVEILATSGYEGVAADLHDLWNTRALPSPSGGVVQATDGLGNAVTFTSRTTPHPDDRHEYAYLPAPVVSEDSNRLLEDCRACVATLRGELYHPDEERERLTNLIAAIDAAMLPQPPAMQEKGDG